MKPVGRRRRKRRNRLLKHFLTSQYNLKSSLLIEVLFDRKEKSEYGFRTWLGAYKGDWQQPRWRCSFQFTLLKENKVWLVSIWNGFDRFLIWLLPTRERRCSRNSLFFFFPVFSASHALVQKRYNDTCCVVVQMAVICFQISLPGLDVLKNALLKFNIAISTVFFLNFLK